MVSDKYKRLWNLERECYKCGRKIYYKGFFRKACFWNVPNGLERELIEEIWGNPLFILECCYCFAGFDYIGMPHVIVFRRSE